MHPYRRALYLTLATGVVISVIAFFNPYFWVSPVIFIMELFVLELSPDLLVETLLIAAIIVWLIWVWRRAVRQHTAVPDSSSIGTSNITENGNLKVKKTYLVVILPIVIFAVTVGAIILQDRCCTSHSGEDWSGFGYTLMIILATIVSIIVSYALVFIAKRWRTMWVVAVILTALYAIAVFVSPIYQILGDHAHQRRFTREIQASKNSADIKNCSVLVTDAYADNKGGALNFEPWHDCVSRTLKTESDYQACRQQASLSDKYLTPHLILELTKYCDFRNVVISTPTFSQCAQYDGQQLQTCLKQIVVDATTLKQCTEQITDTNKAKLCRLVFAENTNNSSLKELLACLEEPGNALDLCLRKRISSSQDDLTQCLTYIKPISQSYCYFYHAMATNNADDCNVLLSPYREDCKQTLVALQSMSRTGCDTVTAYKNTCLTLVIAKSRDK